MRKEGRLKNGSLRGQRVGSEVKEPSIKPGDGLSSIPRTHLVEKDNQLP